jgi:hypothetical protein
VKPAEPAVPGLRGLENNRKKVRLVVAAHNLGLTLRKLLGSGKPREFSGRPGLLISMFSPLQAVLKRSQRLLSLVKLFDRVHDQ